MSETIRLLRADEIEARVQIVTEKGFSLLLYKDARCDMKILDEVFGIYGWKRRHEVINGNLFCTISIYDKATGEWVDKQDVGTESYTEKEKGQASDAFKRAGFNVGIGRELYTAPFIWITPQNDIEQKNGKNTVKSTFKVTDIGYNDNREINHLVIVDNRGNERYRLGKKTSSQASTQATTTNTNNVKADTPTDETSDLKCTSCGVEINQAVSAYSTKWYGKDLCRDCQAKESK